MLLAVYAIYDSVAKESGPLFMAKNDAVAMRMAKGNLDQVGQNLPDFLLVQVGTYDPETCQLDGITPVYHSVIKAMISEEHNAK